ncbi:MAG: alpha/beta fold hydrolase [Acidobacteria bacterium]|nr:alpha/beta fold hydrolase [Acidobacteriota bacterium]MBV9475510.1 alpha/beta fold hydrolase [Acidobacteriota bacterium]
MNVAFAGMTFPAALTLPEGELAGAVLLVPGSLFSNADGDYPSWNFYPRVYAQLAEQLARRGWASLRYAKPGPGTGTEVIDAAAAVSHRRFRTRVDVARVALAMLREATHPPRVLVAGHSEGAVVAFLLAQEERAIDGVVGLAAPSTGLLSIMREQVEPAPEALANFDAAMDHVRRGEAIPAALCGIRGTELLGTMNAAAWDYIRDVDAVDPAAEAAKCAQPLLLVQGEADTSVRPHHAQAIAARREAASTTVALFDGIQHFFKRGDSFMAEGDVDPRVADAIDRWGRQWT